MKNSVFIFCLLSSLFVKAQQTPTKEDLNEFKSERLIPKENPKSLKERLKELLPKIEGGIGVSNAKTDFKKEDKDILEHLQAKEEATTDKKTKKHNNPIASKVIKKKKNTTEYKGIPMLRVLNSFGSSAEKGTVEEFYVMKEAGKPIDFAREIYWYDANAREITTGAIKDLDYAQILHGPYQKYSNGILVEEGFYYLGAKDGRWEKYDKENILIDKYYYKKGFSAEGTYSYYDEAKTKIKQLIPKQFSRVTGNYYAFYESGLVKEEGLMEDSVKIGKWVSYYPKGSSVGRRKKEIMYGKTKFDTAQPITLREYDEKGKLTYEYKK